MSTFCVQSESVSSTSTQEIISFAHQTLDDEHELIKSRSAKKSTLQRSYSESTNNNNLANKTLERPKEENISSHKRSFSASFMVKFLKNQLYCLTDYFF